MAEKKVKKIAIPKKMGTCVDKLYNTQQDRLRAQKVVDDLKAVESVLKQHIIENLPKSDATGIAGKVARATIKTTEIPQADDWKKFYAYVKKTGRFDLMQKRLAGGAILDMQEDGKKVPGIKNYTAKKVSLNKV